LPVEFLSDEQARRYGRFSGDPTREQLDGHFFLDEQDLKLVRERRGESNRLGFGVQLGTVRFLGTFLPDPTDVPPVVASYVARQFDIIDPCVLSEYARRPNTFREHTSEIRHEYGYKDYSDTVKRIGLLRFLYARAWLGSDGPTGLFDLATARLAERKVLLPGVTTLAREVARVRDRVNRRLWAAIASAPDTVQRERLLALLKVPEDARFSELDRLRRGPTSVTAAGLVGALERLDEVRALGLGGVDVSGVPPNRLEALARYGSAAKAQQLSQMREDRRVATLLATVQRLEGDATDDALEVLGALMKKTGSRVDREGAKARVKGLPALDQAALALREALLVAIGGEHDTVEGLLAAVFRTVPKERILDAAEAVEGLVRPVEDVRTEDLMRRFTMVRKFVPRLLSSVPLGSTPAGEPVLEAWTALRRIEGRKRVRAEEMPLDAVTGSWRRSVVWDDGTLNRPAYTLWALEALCGALRRRDVFAPEGVRYSDPRAHLLSGAAWEAQRKLVCDGLGLSPDPSVTLAALGEELDAAYRSVAEGLERNAQLLVGPVEGKKGDRARLEEDEALEESESLKLLRHEVETRLPKVDLPELLMEVDAWTGFASAFSHLSEARGHLDGLPKSVVAVLTAEATNVGFEPIARASDPALTRSRLSYVDQNYVRAETIAAANARLVDHQATTPLAQTWGGGRLASVDGMGFRVPVRTVNATPNPKYFGWGRGLTYLNFVSDQATGFHAIVVPGTLRDSLYVLDGLLEQNTTLEPTQVTGDTHAYTDLVFGLFRLLGYQFSPRIADLEDLRYWRLGEEADYGPLDGLARNRVKADLIAEHWDDILRVAGSLLTRTVKASDILRVLQADGKPRSLGKAIAELGKLPKTVHLLNYLNDGAYRRTIGGQLNLHEQRHSLARAVFFGKKGEVRKRYREGQEDQLGALGLVVNAVSLWNTRYVGLALEALAAEGFEARVEDVERLSPLRHEHVNLLGRYQFSLADDLLQGGLRPLRRPGILEDD
jgi:TnpA family transposase